MQTPARAARLGMTIAISGIMALVLAIAGIYVLLKYAPAGRPAGHLQIVASEPAGANAIVRRTFQRRFMASAVLDLPPVAPQTDSPSLQVTFFQLGALVQGGVIRTRASRFHLVAFRAYTSSDPRQRVRYFGPLADGPHTVTLSGDERTIDFAVDGKVLERVARSTYLPEIGPSDPWMMMGTAVAGSGNQAFGTISHVYVRDEDDRAPVAIVPKCIVTSGSIAMTRTGSAFQLGGRYVPGSRARLEHPSIQELPG